MVMGLGLIIASILLALCPVEPKAFKLHKIVGGIDISIEDVPYQVSITDTYGYHFCGGAIVSEWFIITAGHCLVNSKAESIRVRTKSSFIHKGGELSKVKRILAHELYQIHGQGVDYDIGLIELETPLKLGEEAEPIPLIDGDDSLEEGDVAFVTGWGYINDYGTEPESLQGLRVPVINPEVCNVNYDGDLTERMFCAGFQDGGKDACQGDSGGPITFKDKLVGLVSWGKGCAQAGSPGVYTNIAALRDWWDENAVLTN